METITNASFQNLTKTEQVVMIINSGEELMCREDEGYIVHLYLLSGLFIEVWYESDTQKIVNVESTNKDSITRNYHAMNELVKKLFTD